MIELSESLAPALGSGDRPILVSPAKRGVIRYIQQRDAIAFTDAEQLPHGRAIVRDMLEYVVTNDEIEAAIAKCQSGNVCFGGYAIGGEVHGNVLDAREGSKVLRQGGFRRAMQDKARALAFHEEFPGHIEPEEAVPLQRAATRTASIRPRRISERLEPVAAAANGAFVSAGKAAPKPPNRPA
jgi:hypothetical protein